MKKILKGLLFAFVAVLGLSLASCEKSEHNPVSATAWQSNESAHWQDCAHCEENINAGYHTFCEWQISKSSCYKKRSCVTCGYIEKQDLEHDFTEWSVVKAAADGCNSLSRTCNSCGKVETKEEHTGAWSYDSGSHWLECSTAGEYLYVNSHEFGDWYVKDGLSQERRDCVVCGFTQKKSPLTVYYVRGSLNNWLNDGFTEEYKLAIDEENFTSTITLTLEAGTEFKVADTGWGAQFNAEAVKTEEGLFDGTDNIIVKETAEYVITVTNLNAQAVCTIIKGCAHTYSDWALVEGETCVQQKVCSKCQDTQTQEVHELATEWELVDEATCTYALACTKEGCTHADTKVEHKYPEAWTAVEGETCLESRACEVCGSKETKETHTYENHVCTKCDTNRQLYVKGGMNGWSADPNFALELQKNGTAVIVIEIEAGKEFKVADADWSFDFNFNTVTAPAGILVNAGGNIKVAQTGTYMFVVSGFGSADGLTCICVPYNG